MKTQHLAMPAGVDISLWTDLQRRLEIAKGADEVTYHWLLKGTVALTKTMDAAMPKSYRMVQEQLMHQCFLMATHVAAGLPAEDAEALIEEIEKLADEVFQDELSFQVLMRRRPGHTLH